MSKVRKPFIATLALMAVGVSTGAASKTSYVYGPRPDWSRFVELGNAAVRRALPDPDAWEVIWPNGYIQGYWAPGGRAYGYVTCAAVRAVKPVGGGYPIHPFVIVIDQDTVKKLDLKLERNQTVEILCAAAVARGNFPPAKLMPGAGAVAGPSRSPDSNEISSLGLSIRTMPEGAYVTKVVDGSPTARAGLVPGMVITKANGIALAGMGEAIGKLLAADTPRLTLETATGATVTVERAQSK